MISLQFVSKHTSYKWLHCELLISIKF